jgi:hypothetical protein
MSPIGISIGDEDVAIPYLFEGIFLIYEFGEAGEDGDPPAFRLQFLRILVEHVEDGYIGEVDGLDQAFKLLNVDYASTIEIDDLSKFLDTLVLLQTLQELLLGELFDLYALDYWPGGGS